MRKFHSNTATQMEKAPEKLDKIEADLRDLRSHFVSHQTFVKNVEKHLLTNINELPLPYFYFRLDEQIQSLKGEIEMRFSLLEKLEKAYMDVLNQQREFMKQQSDVMKQQASVVQWIKYASFLLPVAAVSISVIQIIAGFLGIG